MYKSTLVYASDGRNVSLSEEEWKTLEELGVTVVDTFELAREVLEASKHFVAILITKGELSLDVDKYLRLCHDKLGVLSDLQVVVCDDPTIQLQAVTHEIGVKNFWSREGFLDRFRSWLNQQYESLSDTTRLPRNYDAAIGDRAMLRLKTA